MKIYLLTWGEPSKYLEGELKGHWETFYKKEEAEKRLAEVKLIKSATNINLQETEATSL